MIVGGAGGIVLYVLTARWMKIAELGYFVDLARTRLPRPRPARNG